MNEVRQAQYDLRQPATKLRFWDDYLATLNQGGLDIEQEFQDLDDSFLGQLLSSFTGDVLTIVPDFYQSGGYNVVNPTAVSDTATVTLREKLFGYKTVNFLNPFKLYKQMGEWYPLALQDYKLSFNMSTINNP